MTNSSRCSDPPESRPPQFSLRALLVATTGAAVYFSLVTWLRMPLFIAGVAAILGLIVVIVCSLPNSGFTFGVLFLFHGMPVWISIAAGVSWVAVNGFVVLLLGAPASVLFCGLVREVRRRIFNPFNRR